MNSVSIIVSHLEPRRTFILLNEFRGTKFKAVYYEPDNTFPMIEKIQRALDYDEIPVLVDADGRMTDEDVKYCGVTFSPLKIEGTDHKKNFSYIQEACGVVATG